MSRWCLQLFIPYRRYARFLTVLTFSLFAYVALLFMLKLDWAAIGAGLIGLHPNLTDDAATTIVAIFGTTISPYLFFWQSAQEVEEVDQKPDEHPLLEAPAEAPAADRAHPGGHHRRHAGFQPDRAWPS